MLHSFDVRSANLRRSASALLVALGLLCALCVFFVFEVADLRRTLRELRDNDLVRIETRNILVDLLDAEAGQRGFLLTGDPKFLEQYQHGRNHVSERIRRSREDAAMDEQLKGDAAQIMLLADSRLEELARTVALKRQGHDAAALDVVKGGYGKSGMDRARLLIQTNLEQLRLERDRLLEDLNRRIERSATLLVLILGTVVALSLHAWRSLATSARVNNELAGHLAMEATHDALTGLPNRRFFDMWARQLLGKNRRDQSCFTLFLIDLDGFKKVNDTLGHSMGDEVLKVASARFQATLRAGELLARLGGDEFALLIEGNVSRIELIGLAERLISSLRIRLHDDLADDAVGASIGVARFPQNGSDIDMLVEAADGALYQSKEGGRGMVSFAPTGRCCPT
ncbi:MAG: diguanylate cyclase [Massilia sp.]|nr:diguanylate cyclase [Massilia sp.]